MSGSIGLGSPSPHSAAAAAAHPGAGAAAPTTESVAVGAVTLLDRAAASTTPISDMFPALADDPTYVTGESEIPFYENLRAQHASPLEHMPEFYDKILGYLAHATDAILANNPKHQAKIDALRTELDSFQTAQTLNLPHVLYLSFKIAALCSDFSDDTRKTPDGFFSYFKINFFEEYACSDEEFSNFTFEKYADEVPWENKQALLEMNLPVWPVPFFGESAEFGFTTYNYISTKGCFPIGFPTKNGEPDGYPTHSLGFAIHDWVHWKSNFRIFPQTKLTRHLELTSKFANILHELSLQQTIRKQQKSIQIISFLCLHETISANDIQLLFLLNGAISRDTYLVWRKKTENGLQSLLAAPSQEISYLKDCFIDAGYPESTERYAIPKELESGNDQLEQQLWPAFDEFLNTLQDYLFPEETTKA